jgi:hypothetical protein
VAGAAGVAAGAAGAGCWALREQRQSVTHTEQEASFSKAL